MTSRNNTPMNTGQMSGANMTSKDVDWQLLHTQSDDQHLDIGLEVKHRYPKSGELYKEGHIMKSWKSRWFVLDNTTKVISYYEDRSCKEHRGDIHLGHHCQITKEDDHGDRRYIINVTGLKRNSVQTTYLSCGAEHERNQWFDALSEVAFGPLVSIPEIFPDPFRSETRLRIVYTMDNQDRHSEMSSSDPHFNNKTTPKRRTSTKPTVVVHNGTYVQPMVTNSKPMVTYETDHHHMWQHTDLFTLIAIDPDVPSRSNPTNCAFVQWMVCNIRNNDINHGQELLKYLGPAPTIGSGVHRIFFFLFKQPKKFTPHEIGELKVYFGVRDKVSLWKWIQKYGMGLPVAAEGFCSEWDESCSTNIYDLMLGSIGVTPSHTFSEKNAELEHTGISDSCCGLERMLINFSTYHTIACPCTACCNEVDLGYPLFDVDPSDGKTRIWHKLDESRDNEFAKQLAHEANHTCCARFSRYQVIDCFPDSLMWCPPDGDAVVAPQKTQNEMDQERQRLTELQNQESIYAKRLEREAEYSCCNRYSQGEQVECCDDFDYRHCIGDAWQDFCTKTKNLWDRFMGFRAIGCCADLDDTADGPHAIMEASKAYKYYSDLHKKRVFSKVNNYHTVGCCTHIPEDDAKAKEHEEWVERRSPCGRFYRFEVIRGCVPMNKQLEDHFRIEALRRQEIEGMTVCEAFCDEQLDDQGHFRTVNMCELCFHVRRDDGDGDYVAGGYEEALKHSHDYGDAVQGANV